MQRLPEGFCVDRTEVTRGQYASWLATEPVLAAPSPCDWNEGAVPAVGWPPAESDRNLPVVGIDWCDAAAFCRDAGKELCGAPDGGDAAWSGFDDATQSAWYAACSSGGRFAFSYGDAYEAAACNVYDSPTSGCTTAECVLWPVGTSSACASTQPGYEGVFDLTGNVWEWENACESATGREDRCRVRGGSVYNQGKFTACGYVLDASEPSDGRRGDVQAFTGFRCCARPAGAGPTER